MTYVQTARNIFYYLLFEWHPGCGERPLKEFHEVTTVTSATPTQRQGWDMRTRPTQTNDTELVVAARAGDRSALDELVRAHLPVTYNFARRALSAHPDVDDVVDDVVQDIMLRAVQQLPQLRAPESFRPWLTAIAVHQISTHLDREKVAARRTADLAEIAGTPDTDAEFEAAALLRVELTSQRRQVMDAGQWLAPEDRVLLPLWWLETTGELTGVVQLPQLLSPQRRHRALG